jgi:hypothetical protein
MHKFKIGERLFPSGSAGLDAPDGAYVVLKRLPMRDGEFEYQIRSLTERDERVVRESELRPHPLGKKLIGWPHISAGKSYLRNASARSAPTLRHRPRRIRSARLAHEAAA